MQKALKAKGNNMKNYYMLLLILTSTLSGMKRQRVEEISPKIKKARIEQQTPLEQLPNELKVYLLQFLVNVIGATSEEKLYQAATNIRNFMQTSSAFAPFLSNEYIQGFLIRELAKAYADNDIVQAAFILDTAAGKRWLTNRMLGNNKILEEFESGSQISAQTQDIKVKAQKELESDQYYIWKNLLDASKEGNIAKFDFVLNLILIVQQITGHTQLINIQDENGLAPLLYAAQEGHLEIIKKLLTYADVNKADVQGRSALWLAINNDHEHIMDELLMHDADINQADNNGTTPLMVASQAGYDSMVRKLIEQGAIINQADNTGLTPLIFASFWGYPEIVRFLLQNDADITAVDNTGKTALDHATDDETIALLQEYV